MSYYVKIDHRKKFCEADVSSVTLLLFNLALCYGSKRQLYKHFTVASLH